MSLPQPQPARFSCASQVNAVIMAVPQRRGCAVAARVYDGGHLMAYVGAMDLEIRPGPGSYGMRVSPSAQAYGAALSHTVRQFGWHKVVTLSSTDYAATGIVDAFRNALQVGASKEGIEATLDEDAIRDSDTIFRAATAVPLMTCELPHRIRTIGRVKSHCTPSSAADARRIFPLAIDMGLVGKGWTWLGVDWLSDASTASWLAGKDTEDAPGAERLFRVYFAYPLMCSRKLPRR